jgi:glucokinase
VYLGIDIGGTRLKAALVDASGVPARSHAVPSPLTLAAFRRAMAELIEAASAGVAVDGVGIGCKGIIRADTLVESLPGTLDYLEGHKLAEFVAPLTPVSADNDAHAALAGELIFGAARGKRDVVMLTLGTGVGGAMVQSGVLVRGHAGVAGHAGHLTVDADGPNCICGNRGCLETRFSARALEMEAIGAVLRGCGSMLRDRYQANPLGITCADVVACAREGDAVARSIWDQGVKYLADALVGLLHVLDPEVVILGGQIAEAGEMLFEPLWRDVPPRTMRLLKREVPIVPAQVGDGSGVVGAASLVMYSKGA